MERDIEKYLNYPIANQDLFQQTTSAIRGMVELEQVELNREEEERERQRDREQIELYKQEEEEQKDCDFRGRQAPLNLYRRLFSRDHRAQKKFRLLTK